MILPPAVSEVIWLAPVLMVSSDFISDTCCPVVVKVPDWNPEEIERFVIVRSLLILLPTAAVDSLAPGNPWLDNPNVSRNRTLVPAWFPDNGLESRFEFTGEDTEPADTNP